MSSFPRVLLALVVCLPAAARAQPAPAAAATPAAPAPGVGAAAPAKPAAKPVPEKPAAAPAAEPAVAPEAAPAHAASAIAFAGASLLATGGDDGIVRLWNPSLAREVSRLPKLGAAVRAIAATADGALVAAADLAGGVRVFERESQALALEASIPAGAASHLAFAPDGQWLAVWGDGPVRLWKRGEGAISELALPDARALAWLDATTFAAALGDGSVRVWNATTAAESRKLEVEGVVTSLAAASANGPLAIGRKDGSLAILELATGRQVARADAHAHAVAALAFAGPSVLVTAAMNEPLQQWNARDGRSLRRIGGPDEGCCTAIAMRADGRVAFVASPAHVRGFELASGAELPRIAREALAAPAAAAEGTPELTIEVSSASPAGHGPNTGRVLLLVRNTGAVAALGLGLDGATGGAGLVAVPPAVVARLEPGAQVELPIIVSALAAGAPATRDESLVLALAHAGGAGPSVTVPIHVKAPRLDIERVAIEGARQTPVVRAQLTNAGDDATGPLTLAPVFVREGEVVGTAPLIRLSDLTPGERAYVAVAATPEILAGGAELRLEASAEQWPTHTWTMAAPLHRSLPWLPIGALAAALLVLLWLVYVVRVSRHPIVLQVQRDPNELRRYELARLPAVHGALRRARRLDEALTAAKLSEDQWDRIVAAAQSPEQAARALAASLGGKLGDAIPGQPAWKLELPAMHLRFPRATAIAAIGGKGIDAGTAAALANAIHSDGAGPTVAVALDLTATQSARELLQATPRLSFVVLSASELRDVVLAAEPWANFQAAVAAQRPVAELSPYQSSGGVEDESIFFGRDRELRAIADRTLHNVIVVAPRQMGKSSLLKAVQRRLAARDDVEVHHITLFEDDLPARVARQLGQPKPENAEAFLELAAGKRKKPRVWLIDEADSFILRDSRNRYPISLAMRTLAEEGRAYFVLAGFWHLYAAAFLNPNNPLRNFGELIRLGPLDREAARELATKPMSAMGLEYESAELVDRILDETACRAHLVVSVCRGILEGLDPKERVLTKEHVERGLFQNPGLNDEFKFWRRDPLGRAVVRAALMGESPSRGALRERLAAAGLNPASELFAATLDKLELGYVLVTDQAGQVVCPVPLMRRFIMQDEDLAAGLRRDAEDFRSGATEDVRAAG